MLSGGHFLASHDLTTEGSPALTELIDLEAQRRRIDHRQAVLLTEVAASGVCDIEHGHTTPMWLADRTQQSPHACRSRMNTAARLHRRYPQLAEALKTGRVGWQHVKVIDSAGNDRNWQDLADLLPGLIDLSALVSLFLTNVLTLEEMMISFTLVSIGSVLMFAYTFIGLIAVHEYSFGAAIGSLLLTVVAMMIIVFILMLLFTLAADVIDFVRVVYKELMLKFA